VSFLVTNIPADDGPNIVGIEAWFRCRTDIEDRIREAKLGAGLRHLPSADRGDASLPAVGHAARGSGT